MIFRSIRWRLQLWHGILLLLVLAGFGFTAYRLQYANELRRVDQELQRRLGPVQDALRRPPPGGPGGPGRPGGSRPGEVELDGSERGGARARQMEGEFPPRRELRLSPNRAALFEGDSNAFYYVVWSRDGRESIRSTAADVGVPYPGRSVETRPAATARMRGTKRELYEFNTPGECILVGRSITQEMAGLRSFALKLIVLGAGVLVFGLAGGWWMATQAIRPIHDISAAAEKIAGGDLSHRVQAADSESELGRLAGVLNSTFARLEAAFHRQEQFTADASHELRTPITVVLNQTQSVLARERSAPEYREALEACQRAAQRMRSLTESLLALARLDAGRDEMNRVEFDLGHLTGECIKNIHPLASERCLTVSTDLAPAQAVGDAGRVAQVITNLLSNAIAYNDDGGEIRINTRRDNGTAILTVWNSGPGIPADDLPQIFERFHRADKSRRASGHSGLGLAIAKAVVDAHGGSITAQSSQPGGTTFTVTLPRPMHVDE